MERTVNYRRTAEPYFFINALVAINKSMQLRTTAVQPTHLNRLGASLDLSLNACPAAITLSKSGVLDTERLLGEYLKNDNLFRPITKSRRIMQWRCYAQKP